MRQMQMFAAAVGPEAVEIGLRGGHLTLHPGFCSAPEAEHLYGKLVALPGWRQDSIVLFGKRHPLPRLHRWFADAGQTYRWSGLAMVAERFPRSLHSLRVRLAAVCATEFNTALGNLYRGGQDSVSWHSDDEPELGSDPCIASLSLGAERSFLLRRRDNRSERVAISLPHGSLLVMSGETQRNWQHCIPKARRVPGSRVNLTFRHILPHPSPPAATG